MQRSGAGSLGEEGPNAPMVLGTKRRREFSRARSKTLCNPEETKGNIKRGKRRGEEKSRREERISGVDRRREEVTKRGDCEERGEEERGGDDRRAKEREHKKRWEMERREEKVMRRKDDGTKKINGKKSRGEKRKERRMRREEKKSEGRKDERRDGSRRLNAE